MENSTKVRATTAAALLLAAGQAEAATIVIPLNQLLTNGGGALSGQFNVSTLLTDSSGNEYRATGGTVVAYGYSDAVTSAVQPGAYGPAQLVSSYYSPGYSYSHSCGWWSTCWEYVPGYQSQTYQAERVTLLQDNVQDAMALTAGAAGDVGTVGFSEGSLGPSTFVNSSSSNGYNGSYYWYETYNYYERQKQVGQFGELSAGLTLGAGELASLNGSGLLNYTIAASNGQFRADNLVLNIELERVISNAVPEPQTWAMLVLGFGLLGAGLRRRRVEAATA